MTERGVLLGKNGKFYLGKSTNGQTRGVCIMDEFYDIGIVPAIVIMVLLIIFLISCAVMSVLNCTW